MSREFGGDSSISRAAARALFLNQPSYSLER